uniref:Shugoshin C-terminal domain-containing protein n=1 Tax=Acrobeloides nanus TaxID=290746 RepID=A0A914DQ20_9BILA
MTQLIGTRFQMQLPCLWILLEAPESARKNSEILTSARRRSEELGRARKNSEALGCTRKSSDALRITQRHSEALGGAQKHSEVLLKALGGAWKHSEELGCTRKLSEALESTQSHLIEHSMQADLISLHDQSMQTEIAQFQLDELALKLHAMQAATQIKPALVECGVETSLKEDPPKAKKKEKHMSSKVVQANLKPRFKDKATLTEPAKVENRSMETEICLTNNRSMETTNAGLWRGECSRSVQTAFDEEQNAELTNKPEDNASNKRRRFSLQRMQSCDGIETSIQCSLAKPDICDTGVQTEYDEDFQFNERRRSLSNISLMGDSLDIDKEKEKAAPKQDLIIQTDDSYLKIARRLDEYRTNKTQFLPVYAAPQKASNVKMADSSNLATQASTTQHAANRKSDRPPSTIFENPHETTPNGSEPAGPIGTRSRPQKAKKKPTTTNISTITNTPTTSNNEPSLKPEKSRSISPKPRKPSISKIGRQSSINLPLSVPRGKVTAFVTQHEKGIHNPGTPEGRRRSLVTIVREKE